MIYPELEERISFAQAIKGMPTVDKDEIPSIVAGYRGVLRNIAHVSGRSLNSMVAAVESVVFDGNPDATEKAVRRMSSIVEACSTKSR